MLSPPETQKCVAPSLHLFLLLPLLPLLPGGTTRSLRAQEKEKVWIGILEKNLLCSRRGDVYAIKGPPQGNSGLGSQPLAAGAGSGRCPQVVEVGLDSQPPAGGGGDRLSQENEDLDSHHRAVV